MLTVAVTGGIAMGKSTFCAMLVAENGPLAGRVRFFDCDLCVRELLTEPEIVGSIATVFGDSVITSHGQIDRPRLRERVFNSAQQRAELENILHPVVRQRCVVERDRARGEPAVGVFAVDVPLLYESGFDLHYDLAVVVVCSADTQMTRLLQRPGITKPTAERIVSAQLPAQEKIQKADVVLWNDGLVSELTNQTDLFCQWLKKKIPM
jgi:dephospho-CoA kinase